jgi:chemotaxis protein CheD
MSSGEGAAEAAQNVGPRRLARRAPRRAVYLHPGFVHASLEPTEATTILGSCVAVCLWDQRLQVGGANHFLLPRGGGADNASARFGDIAIRILVSELTRLGCQPRALQAKVFGGAAVVEAFRGRDNHLGAQNVELALALLRELEIPVVARDVEGHRGRKVIFHTDTGIALVRLV